MKAKRLRGVVTLEMSEEELDQLVVDLKCALWRLRVCIKSMEMWRLSRTGPLWVRLRMCWMS
jgi:ribosomal protein L29